MPIRREFEGALYALKLIDCRLILVDELNMHRPNVNIVLRNNNNYV